MKKQLNIDEEVYICVTFKIKRGAITKLIDFLKQNTKTYLNYGIKGEESEKVQN